MGEGVEGDLAIGGPGRHAIDLGCRVPADIAFQQAEGGWGGFEGMYGAVGTNQPGSQ